jgi:chitodextrinase
MKITTLALWFLIIGVLFAKAQNLHNSSNAASIENESFTTTGWNGTATILADSSTSYLGNYSLRFAVNGSGREARYSFSAIPGDVYNISIRARRSNNSSNPAFANWTGMSGVETVVINSLTWMEYTFTATAISTNPIIRVFAGPIGASNGREVFIDAVSILPQLPSDTEPPTAPSELFAADVTSTSLLLSWNASTDNEGVTHYEIRQNNVPIANINHPDTSFIIMDLYPNTLYDFQVTSFDAANNTSSPTFLSVTTLPDTIAPTSPEDLTAEFITTNSFKLEWNEASDNVAVAGYAIYLDSVFVDSLDSSTTFYYFTGLMSDTSYTTGITAFDASGNVSIPGTLIVTTLQNSVEINYTSENANRSDTDWNARNLFVSQSMGIGTSPNNDYALSVNGSIRSKEIIVESGWSDFVFEQDYDLATLEEVENYIIEHGHLKDIPSAAEVQSKGIGLAKMNTLLLMKIEEITLYLIEANKRIKQLENQLNTPMDIY